MRPWIDVLIDGLEAVNERLGRGLAWFALFMVLIQVAVVVLRYGFDIGSIALQESVVYLHALLFMLGAGYALKHDAHVRVDIFYRRCSPQARAWIDLSGTVMLLLPVCVLLLVTGSGYVFDAWGGSANFADWASMEKSREAGGLPLVWLLKTAIILLPILLLLQGLAIVLRSIRLLQGKNQNPPKPLPIAPEEGAI